ncbi:MAG: hypothetical protein M4579_007264 [Chaenotheca gracillima]|nr:MAG: hypothetical protein M4579_007264 [Chaenotheca gracillima]
MEGGNQGGSASGANSSSDFVRKLYKMLEDPSYDQVVRWGNDGESFVVLEVSFSRLDKGNVPRRAVNNEKFTKAILPKHFKHSNFASFVRQLNKYDFHKVRHNNEENGQSPYGAGAWEFKHPEFKMNSKDSLDNIRRKAPAPRKPNQAGDDMVPTQQMDLVNTQMLAMQQQLQQLSDRYNELSMHHSVLLSEMIGMQKTVVNHEHVMQNVMSYLHSAESFIRDQRRNSRTNGPFGPPAGAMDTSSQQVSPVDETPPSPLQNAEKLLNDSENIMSNRNLDHMSELYRQMNTVVTTPPPDSTSTPSRNGTAQSMHPGPAPAPGGIPTPAASSSTMGYGRLHGDMAEVVYPAGQTNGIDPMFSEHINNIPYPMPSSTEMEPTDPRKQFSEGRKKSTTIDPGWIRPPQILLVEDDSTCRRIGGKFLYSFKCHIDSAFDGLEAVNKMNAGSKYDLVLMDIIMPNLDGVSACHLIRQFDATPIIAMTSNIRSDDITMYFAHGMNDVLPKPFTKEGLLNMLEKHLSHLKDPSKLDGLSQQTPSATQQGQPGQGQGTHPLSAHHSHTHSGSASARQSLKDESSPAAKSPLTAPTWHSPHTSSNTGTTNTAPNSAAPGISPTTPHGALSDEYMNAFRGGYGDHDASPMGGYQGMGAPRGPGAIGSGGPHRRQISEMSSGEDLAGEAAKRQRGGPGGYGGMQQRGRPGG